MEDFEEKNIQEPSVLDFLKSRLMPWRGVKVNIPVDPETAAVPEPVKESGSWAENIGGMGTLSTPETGQSVPILLPQTRERIEIPFPDVPQEAASIPLPAISDWPWRTIGALLFALVAQITFEPPNRSEYPGVLFYLVAALLMGWALFKGEWRIPEVPDNDQGKKYIAGRVSVYAFALVLLPLLFLNFRGNQFTQFNLILWLGVLFFTIAGFWGQGSAFGYPRLFLGRIRSFFKVGKLEIKITPWGLMAAGTIMLTGFFMVFRLGDVAPEMNSDHAEKLLDVFDILQGKFSIFFHRNTGREPLYIYLSAWVADFFGTGITFLTLKIAAVIGYALTLPFIYLLGKEVAGKRAGLFAVIFAGIGYWPIVQTRFALRISFYPLFVAPSLYFFIRGLKHRNRNDFLLSGLFLGLGLMGYTPFRIVPIAMVVLFGVYLLHQHAAGNRMNAIWGFALLVVISFVAVMPLLSYAIDNPEPFAYRAFSRVGTAERPIIGSPIGVFLKNLWTAMIMFFWDDGEIWVHSVPGRPALDVVSAVLFFFGYIGIFIRYLRKRNWLDILLLLSVPLLLMPSILSLAFPNENPALNRMVGAVVPVFVIVGIVFDGLLTTLGTRFGTLWGKRIAVAAGFFLIFWSASHNYDLIFQQYFTFYKQNAWNTSEMGEVIQSYSLALGDPERAFVVPFPHWVDTRLVGMTAGLPDKDYAIPRENLPVTLATPGSKMFLVNPLDLETLDLLNELYPGGILTNYESAVQFKDFFIFVVLPE